MTRTCDPVGLAPELVAKRMAATLDFPPPREMIRLKRCREGNSRFCRIRAGDASDGGRSRVPEMRRRRQGPLSRSAQSRGVSIQAATQRRVGDSACLQVRVWLDARSAESEVQAARAIAVLKWRCCRDDEPHLGAGWRRWNRVRWLPPFHVLIKRRADHWDVVSDPLQWRVDNPNHRDERLANEPAMRHPDYGSSGQDVEHRQDDQHSNEHQDNRRPATSFHRLLIHARIVAGPGRRGQRQKP